MANVCNSPIYFSYSYDELIYFRDDSVKAARCIRAYPLPFAPSPAPKRPSPSGSANPFSVGFHASRRVMLCVDITYGD